MCMYVCTCLLQYTYMYVCICVEVLVIWWTSTWIYRLHVSLRVTLQGERKSVASNVIFHSFSPDNRVMIIIILLLLLWNSPFPSSKLPAATNVLLKSRRLTRTKSLFQEFDKTRQRARERTPSATHYINMRIDNPMKRVFLHIYNRTSQTK